MKQLIELAKGDSKKSLATLKPSEIIDFVIEEDEREWKQKWLDQLQQMNLFHQAVHGGPREVVRKLPYKYSYKFLSEGDDKPRKLMIEDWEIGALYWNCLKRAEGDEEEANKLVRQKYFETFVAKNDLYLFVGTTQQYHNVSPDPFVIIGVFYPLKEAAVNDKDSEQLSLF